MTTQARPGFSLIEILFAIAILGLVMAVAVPRLMGLFEGAKVDTTKATLRNIKMVLQNVNMKTGRYPEQLKDLLSKNPPSEEIKAHDWQGPYFEKKSDIEDAWKNKLQYQVTPGGAHDYELYSYGPKGKGANKSEHISVWDV